MTDQRLTIIPDVIDWLVTTFTDDPELGEAGVQIIEGDNSDPEREFVAIGDVVGTQEWAAIGARSRDEQFTVDLSVLVARAGNERAEARNRVFEIVHRVESLLRANPTLGITGNITAQFGAVSYACAESGPDDEGFAAAATFAVRVHARI